MREGVLPYDYSDVEMSNTCQKGTVIFQTGIWHPEKQGKKEIAICIYLKQVDISNCISVVFLWIIIELSVRIHKNEFVSSLGDRQMFVSVGLYMKGGQISWVSFHICHVSLHFLKWKITVLSKMKMQNYDGRPWYAGVTYTVSVKN